MTHGNVYCVRSPTSRLVVFNAVALRVTSSSHSKQVLPSQCALLRFVKMTWTTFVWSWRLCVTSFYCHCKGHVRSVPLAILNVRNAQRTKRNVHNEHILRLGCVQWNTVNTVHIVNHTPRWRPYSLPNIQTSQKWCLTISGQILPASSF